MLDRANPVLLTSYFPYRMTLKSALLQERLGQSVPSPPEFSCTVVWIRAVLVHVNLTAEH